jgi:hypothetical protein
MVARMPPAMRPGMAPGPAAGLPPLPPLPPAQLGPGSSRPGVSPRSTRAASPSPWAWLAAGTAIAGGAAMVLLERRRRANAEPPAPPPVS